MNSITSRQRAMIVRLARKGVTSRKIARAAGVCRNTVAKVRRQAGVPIVRHHLDADLTQQALKLLRAGMGYTECAHRLRVPRREVKALQIKHGLRAKMYRTPRADADVEGFKRALLDRQDPQHVKHLAKRFHIDEERGLRIAHRVLGVEHFRRGKSKTPLQCARDWPRGIDVEENRRLAD